MIRAKIHKIAKNGRFVAGPEINIIYYFVNFWPLGQSVFWAEWLTARVTPRFTEIKNCFVPQKEKHGSSYRREERKDSKAENK